jgi:hypothetical protein
MRPLHGRRQLVAMFTKVDACVVPVAVPAALAVMSKLGCCVSVGARACVRACLVYSWLRFGSCWLSG